MAAEAFEGFPAATFTFLDGLAMHNEKTWFDANRQLYDEGYVAPARAFVAAMGPRLRALSPGVQFEPKIGGSIGRINRDIRFSKDKRPYKTHLDLWFWHGEQKGWDRPGFWFHLTAEKVFLGSGLHGMQGDNLEAFRQSVIHPRSAKALLAAVDAVAQAGPYELGEKTRKLLPRGYAADGPAAEYLLYESLHAGTDLPAEAARRADFIDVCFAHYKATWPISQWLLAEVTAG